MKRLLIVLALSFTAIGFAQGPVSSPIPAAASMEVINNGGTLVTVTPTSDVTFHAQGIDLEMKNGDSFQFQFNHGRLGNQPLIREEFGVKEVWYPRLYKDISLRCYVKADGEIGYDWRMGPRANASHVRMTMERRLAGQPANTRPNTFVALGR